MKQLSLMNPHISNISKAAVLATHIKDRTLSVPPASLLFDTNIDNITVILTEIPKISGPISSTMNAQRRPFLAGRSTVSCRLSLLLSLSLSLSLSLIFSLLNRR